MQGFIQGLGKGILGTFAKPTAGVLDLASGLSAAVRGSATRSSRLYQPKRVRSIRNCFGPGGAIPRFSKTNSEGQSIVLKLNANDMDEKYVLFYCFHASKSLMHVVQIHYNLLPN